MAGKMRRWEVVRPRVVVLLLVVMGAVAAGVVVASCSSGIQGTSNALAGSPSPSPAPPLQVTAIRPAPGASDVPCSATIEVRFSQPLAAGSQLPSIVPSVRGMWKVVGPARLIFVPRGYLPPLTDITVLVPGGPRGVTGSEGQTLASPYRATFTTAGGSVLRLQQLLAELGYLPLSFWRTSSAAGSGTNTGATVSAGALIGRAGNGLSAEAREADLVPLTAQPGYFAWRYVNVPETLAGLWNPRAFTVLTQGAVMAFEADHGLDDDGVAGPLVWKALLRAVADRQVTPRPYDYIEVSTSLPETLRVWQNGKVIFTTLANTGIAARPTAYGTFPVYVRYVSTTMSGTNPDGTHYDDRDVPDVAYFHDGQAIHGFVRASYGFPQSLGCVELPLAAAAVVFNYDQIGTLVTVAPSW